MNRNDERHVMTKEEFIAQQLAIVAKYTKVQLKPKPTPEQKAKEVWAKQPLETVAKANRQAEQKEIQLTKEEMQEARRKRQRDQFNHLAQIANERAVELGYFQRQMEALGGRRWDPTGIWGPQHYTDE